MLRMAAYNCPGDHIAKFWRNIAAEAQSSVGGWFDHSCTLWMASQQLVEEQANGTGVVGASPLAFNSPGEIFVGERQTFAAKVAPRGKITYIAR